MDNNLEEIALDFIRKARAYERMNMHYSLLATCGLIDLDELTAHREKIKTEFINAKDLFWEKFKYPLQVFNLSLGQRPQQEETVYVYDEVECNWIETELTQNKYDGQYRFRFYGLGILGSPNEYDRYIRWVRMPELPRLAGED